MVATTTTQASAAPADVPPRAEIGDKVGPSLRARREQLGWDLNDIAAWLRIRLSYLEALEEGRTTDIPGNAYALGFLRTYAGALGFDAEDMVSRFKQEARGIERKPELTFPAPVPDRGIPTGVLMLLGGIVIVGAYAGWYKFTDHVHNAAQYVPPLTDVMPGVTARSTTSPQIASVVPGAGQPPRALPPVETTTPAASQNTASVSPPSGPVMTASPPSPPATSAPPAIVPTPGAEPRSEPATASVVPASPTTAAPSVAPPTVATSSGTATPVPAAAGPSPDQIVLHASAQTWVQIKGADGHVAYDHVLEAGESWPVPQDGGPYVMTVGNAGGLALGVGDAMSPALGRVGGVRRNIMLQAQAIRDGSIAVAPVIVKKIPKPAASVAPASVPVTTPATTNDAH